MHAPTPEQEAVRDLCRAREAAKARPEAREHRLSKFLLRRGVRWTLGRKMWTRAHLEWLRGRRLAHAADQAMFDDHLLALEQLASRLEALDAQLARFASEAPWAESVGWLRCFRGIDTLTALAVVTELHDWQRFDSPRALMAYLGLVPSKHSSGGQERRGAITRAGNGRLRRLLIEAAWHYRHRPAVGFRLRERRRGQPPSVIAIADRAQQRLHARHQRLNARGKPHNKVVTAIARELAGFLWAALDPRGLRTAARVGHGAQHNNGSTEVAAEPGHGLEKRAIGLCDRRFASQPTILDGAALSTEHGHAARPHPGQPAHIRVTRRRRRPACCHLPTQRERRSPKTGARDTVVLDRGHSISAQWDLPGLVIPHGTTWGVHALQEPRPAPQARGSTATYVYAPKDDPAATARMRPGA